MLLLENGTNARMNAVFRAQATYIDAIETDVRSKTFALSELARAHRPVECKGTALSVPVPRGKLRFTAGSLSEGMQRRIPAAPWREP